MNPDPRRYLDGPRVLAGFDLHLATGNQIRPVE
jgi:hypothetical protein